MPPDIFSDLEEATVEFWAKWETLSCWSRPFDFGKESQFMTVNNHQTTANLQFEIWSRQGEPERIGAAGVLRQNQWCHIAAVSGKSGMRLYLNGLLIGTNVVDRSFTSIDKGGHYYLGRSNRKTLHAALNDDFHGQLDEFRVWNVARSETDIRATMFQSLAGREVNLVGLWKFEDGTARDSTAAAHHGRLMGNAKVVESQLPSASDLRSSWHNLW